MSQGLRDERLPTWAHTMIILLIVSTFAAIPAWWGVSAIINEHLPRTENWDGDHWFGGRCLNGSTAVVAGYSLVSLSLSFFSLGLAQLRCAQGRRIVHALPWCFVILAGVLYVSVFLLR